jgi:CO dehydrogenase/acetyl-CoA synthase gamma subunit (corrinoid Fe-S protein)
MALTGIEIFKLLPKTNCGECYPRQIVVNVGFLPVLPLP